MSLSFIFHLQSCKLQSHYFYLPGEKWTFLHDLSSLSLTRKRSSCNYRVVGFFLYCQQQGQGLDVTTINKNWLSTKSPQMQKMKPSKGPMNGWWMGFGSLNTSSYCHWPCQKAFQTCTRSWQVCPGALGGLTGEHWWEAWQGLLGPAVLAGSGCCSFPMWGSSSCALQAVPDPVGATRAALIPWPGGLCAGKLPVLLSLTLLSCSWLSGTLGDAQLPLLLRHLRPVHSYPKSRQRGLACTAAFSASCATTGFSCKFPRTGKQTCNKCWFYRVQKHRRKPGKQTKAGSCKGQQFKYMIMKYIKG